MINESDSLVVIIGELSLNDIVTEDGKTAFEVLLNGILESYGMLEKNLARVDLHKNFVKKTLTCLLCAGLGIEPLTIKPDFSGFADLPKNSDDMLASLKKDSRRICQYAFTKNDIVWVCKDCQADDTCVLCNECFRDSNHEGHEVYFYRTQAGGCCDCGDIDAWEKDGFCSKHGESATHPLSNFDDKFLDPARMVLNAVTKFLRNVFAEIPETANIDAHKMNRENEDEKFVHRNCHLVLHLDDIHSPDYIESTVRNFLNRDLRSIYNSMRSLGERDIAFGYEERSKTETSDCECLVEFARNLNARGLVASIRPFDLANRLCMCEALVDWLYTLSSVSDGVCSLICDALQREEIDSFISAEVLLPRRVSGPLRDLFLTLMTNHSFKMRLAEAYVHALPAITECYVSGRGIAEYSIFVLSVQFLNRGAFVHQLVDRMMLLETLAQCLYNTIFQIHGGMSTLDASGNEVFNPMIQFRRYMPLFSDLRCVLAIKEIPRVFCGVALEKWLDTLAVLQGLDGQIRQLGSHVEYENRGWTYSFNINITICGLFELIVSWLRQSTDNLRTGIHMQMTEKELPYPKEVLFKCLNTVRRELSIQYERIEKAREDKKSTTSPKKDNAKSIEIENASGSPCREDTFELPEISPMRSFHIPLYRFFASVIRETAKSAKHTSDIFSLISACKDIAGDVFDVSLRVLLFASEIKADLWKRNGHCMIDQMVNYIEPPFSRLFWDLDLYLLQFFGIAYGASSVVSHVVRRFWIRDLSTKQELFMSEEMLLLLIHLVTEMPSPPDALTTIQIRRASSSPDLSTSELFEPFPVNARVIKELRREIIHRLAVGPCTFSDIQEASNMVGQADMLSTRALESLLNEIAVLQTTSTALEAGKYTLLAKLYSEYDPTFPHLSQQMHHIVAERKAEFFPSSAKKDCIKPICPQPPLAHECFESFRIEMLGNKHLMTMISSYLRSCMNYEDNPEASSETLLLRAVHMLTLGVYIYRGLNLDSLLLVEYCSVLLECGVPQDLMQLESIPWVAQDRIAAGSILWLLREMRALNHGLERVIPEEKSDVADEKSLYFSSRRAAAQAKAMAAMLEKAKMFADLQTKDASDEETGEEKEEYVNKEDMMDIDVPHEKTVLPVCVVCQETTLEPIKYVAFAQQSGILSLARTTPDRAPPVLDLDPLKPGECSKTRRGFSGVFIQLCGHALHRSCFNEYYESISMQMSGVGRLQMDLEKWEFHCPLCKTLSNTLIPHIPLASGISLDRKDVKHSCADWGLRFPNKMISECKKVFEEIFEENSQNLLEWDDAVVFFKDINRIYMGLAEEDENRSKNGQNLLVVDHFITTCKSVAYTIASASAQSSFKEYNVDHLKIMMQVLRSVVAGHAGARSRIVRDLFNDDSQFSDLLISENTFEKLVMLSVVLPDFDGTFACKKAPALYDLLGACGMACLARLIQLLIGLDKHHVVINESSADLFLKDEGKSYAELFFTPDAAHQEMGSETFLHFKEFTNASLFLIDIFSRQSSGVSLKKQIGSNNDEVYKLLGLPSTLQLMGKDAKIVELCHSWFGIYPTQDKANILKTVGQLFRRHIENTWMNYPYGFPIIFIDLPKSYTDLHSMLMTKTSKHPVKESNPAVCLICGKIMNCGGDGSCWRHTALCSPNSGVFFLLQDCTILLIRGEKAAYFPSPYVDAYGERQKKSRGKPLHLDVKRYQVLLELYARHGVSSEISRIRMSTREILVPGFY